MNRLFLRSFAIAFVTLALEGFSPNEVATVLGISESAASVRLHRAKAALMERIGEA